MSAEDNEPGTGSPVCLSIFDSLDFFPR